MTSLWPRIEPLLARVQKPARYIGCEDGMVTAAHDAKKVAWLLIYPDAYEIGLPNQGLQILYEILNERDDAVAERSLRAVDGHGRRDAAARDPALLGRRPPGRRRLRPARLQPLGRAGVHQRSQLHRPRRRRRASRAPPPGGSRSSSPAVTAPSIPSLSPTSSTSSSSATARRSSRRSPRWSAPGRRRGAPLVPAGGCYGTWPTSPVSTSRRCTRSPTTASVWSASPRPTPTSPNGSRSGPSPTWPRGRIRSSQLVPMTEVVHDRLNVEIFRGCTAWLPVLPGRDDHPTRPRAAVGAGPPHGARRAAADRATTR